jgi:hypothetical protein
MITGNIIYQLTNQMSCSIKMTDYLSSLAVFQCLVCHTQSVRRLEARYIESDQTIELPVYIK